MLEQSPPPRKALRQSRSRQVFGRKQVTILFSLFVLLMLAVFVLRSQQPHEAVQADHADPSNLQLLARGRQLYAIHCASCHGATLEGQTGWQNRVPGASAPAPPLNATGLAQQRSDQEIFSIIRQGSQAIQPPSSAMPAFPHLSESDIWALVSAMKATWSR